MLVDRFNGERLRSFFQSKYRGLFDGRYYWHLPNGWHLPYFLRQKLLLTNLLECL